MFVGFVAMDDTIRIPVLTEDLGVQKDADSSPAYRVYGDSGLLTAAGGLCAFKDEGTITGATNASPIVIASVGHNLTTGMRVTISGVLGNTVANGSFNITLVDSNYFSLDGSVGNGSYAGGGSWHVSGLYDAAITPTIATQFAVGQNFTVIVTPIMSGTSEPQSFTFGVV